MADLIYDHCAAYAELGPISHETDAIVLGRERHLLMRLCAARVGTDAGRRAKASYRLAIFGSDEPSGEHVAAIPGPIMCGCVL